LTLSILRLFTAALALLHACADVDVPLERGISEEINAARL